MNRDIQLFGTALVLLSIVDLPWLMWNADKANRMITKIQGSEMKLRMAPALVVYIALAYIVTQVKEPWDAFKMGVATYAVYDFTNLALFKGYDLGFALADTLWGGILLFTVRYALNRIF